MPCGVRGIPLVTGTRRAVRTKRTHARCGRVLYCVAAWVALSAAAPESASVREVPPRLMEAAECMATVLNAMPGVTDIHIEVRAGNGDAYPVLAYSSRDGFGSRRFTELSLFEISGIEDAPYVFDIADIEGDAVANRILPVWKSRCRAGVGYITSVPG